MSLTAGPPLRKHGIDSSLIRKPMGMLLWPSRRNGGGVSRGAQERAVVLVRAFPDGGLDQLSLEVSAGVTTARGVDFALDGGFLSLAFGARNLTSSQTPLDSTSYPSLPTQTEPSGFSFFVDAAAFSPGLRSVAPADSSITLATLFSGSSWPNNDLALGVGYVDDPYDVEPFVADEALDQSTATTISGLWTVE